MAKVKNPKTLSSHFNIDRARLDRLGVLDPTLAIDTRLFIDPLLFAQSVHPEMRELAAALYRRHFETVIGLLAATKKPDDVPFRNARRLLQFHEVRGTCLGYGAASIYGSGFGAGLTERILQVGKEIVDLGITDPDLFSALALFEEDIGPDRISDMTTNVVFPALVAFNDRILNTLGLDGEEFEIEGLRGRFLKNPYQSRPTPIILLPKDVLRELPIAKDWDDVADAAYKNEILRRRVNAHIAEIWASKAKRDKHELKKTALSNKAAFQTLLDAIHEVAARAYNVDEDPDGLIKWAYVGKEYASGYPIDLHAFRNPANLDDVSKLAKIIIEKFIFLVEHRGLNKELYKDNGNPRHEATAQRLFFAIAYSYCEANSIEISPEIDTGTGQVDFKLSRGPEAKVLVELKLSTNPNVEHGYRVQLEEYKTSERTMRAFYVVIDVGRMGKKFENCLKIKNDAQALKPPLSELVYVNGIKKDAPSKRPKKQRRIKKRGVVRKRH